MSLYFAKKSTMKVTTNGQTLNVYVGGSVSGSGHSNRDLLLLITYVALVPVHQKYGY